MFGVSRQVYYRAHRAQGKRRAIAYQVISLVQETRLIMPRVGTRKLYHILKPQLEELGVGRDKLFSILKANHMLIKPQRQYHITTQSHHRFRRHRNRIEKLEIIRPEQVWVSDITYIGNRKHPIYLSLVTDAYSKKIMGYNVANNLQAQHTVSALKMAIKNRQYKQETLIHHSDRGFQYCSDEYQRILTKNRITCSMTESYDPYANAVAERVNGIIKQEFLQGYFHPQITVMNKIIKQVIDIYNSARPHYSCDMKTPMTMHQQKQIIIKSYKTKKSSNVQIAALF